MSRLRRRIRLSRGQRHGPLLGGGAGGGRCRGRPAAGRGGRRRWPTCSRWWARCTPTGRGWPRCSACARCWWGSGPSGPPTPADRTVRAGRHRRAAAAVRRRLTGDPAASSELYGFPVPHNGNKEGGRTAGSASSPSGRSVTSQGDRLEVLLLRASRRRRECPTSRTGSPHHEPSRVGAPRRPGARLGVRPGPGRARRALPRDPRPARRPRRRPPSSPRAPVLLDGLGHDPGERATLLQFSSAFCAPCRATRRVLGEVAELVPGVRHVEVDAEHHLELVRRLGHRAHADHAHPRRRAAARSPAPAGRRPGTRCWPRSAGSSRRASDCPASPTRHLLGTLVGVARQSVTGHRAGTVRTAPARERRRPVTNCGTRR